MASPVIPTIRYDDSARMVDWLVKVFGFTRRMVVEEADGSVGHAELTLGGGLVMIGQAKDDDWGRFQKTARALGGASASIYLVVADPDAVLARVVAEGGEIVMPISDKPYGGRDFACRDPEGQLWSVGSYDPWAAASEG